MIWSNRRTSRVARSHGRIFSIPSTDEFTSCRTEGSNYSVLPVMYQAERHHQTICSGIYRSALNACMDPHLLVASAVMKMMAILIRSRFSFDWRSRPDIPGMRMSVMKHAVRCCSPEFRNSSADANVKAWSPASLITPCRALRINSSTSAITTNGDLPSLLIPNEKLVLNKERCNYALV